MSNFSDFDDSPPPSPLPNEVLEDEVFEDDFSLPEESEDLSLPPPSDDDLDNIREDVENSVDEDYPPPSDDMDDMGDSSIMSIVSEDEASAPPSTVDPSISDAPSLLDEIPSRGDPPPYILPVKTLHFPPRHADSHNVAHIDSDIESLSSGLVINKVPPIIKAGLDKNQNHLSLKLLPSANSNGSILLVKSNVEIMSTKLSNTNNTTHDSTPSENGDISQGYLLCMGKFEGDPFENLGVKVVGSMLIVKVTTGEIVDFDLSEKSFAFEDTAEQRTLILDYKKTPIVLKFFTDDDYIEFMKALPEVVFIAQDDAREELKQSEIGLPTEKTSSKVVSVVSSKSNPKLQSQHIKGTSVEDLLENDSDLLLLPPANPHGLNTSMLSRNELPPGPPRKKELADSHIRRPKYSVRRVALLCQWINTLRIWPNKLTILTLHSEMVNGVLLARLVKVLNPEVQFVHLNEKALAKKAALENLEQALGHIWRSKSLNNSRIPTAEEIYNGDASKIAILLNELFGVYVQRPLFKSAVKILRWFNHILKQYQRPLPSFVVEEGDLSGIWPHFQSGTALFCVLYHFFGTTTVGQEGDERRLDPLRITGNPTSICDFRDNLLYVFNILDLIGVEVLWTPEDWMTNPDTEFLLLQLSFIFDKLMLRQCSLPPAQGERPGLTSGANGEALVVGLVFNDAPSSLKFVARTKKAVRLGHDGDSMPLLPVDPPNFNIRFGANGFIPRGMVSKDARMSFTELNYKEAKLYAGRNQWNGRTTVRTEKENFVGHQCVNLLRSHHRSGGENSGKDLDKKNKNGFSTFVRSFHFPFSERQEGNASPSQESKDRSTFSYDEFGKDISTLIKSLGEEMISAQRDIQSVEDTLASRYIDLEASAASFVPDEYARALDQLEQERIDLECEKERLKDYFARKLVLIKERKEEVHKKAVDLKKKSVSIIALESDTVVPLNNGICKRITEDSSKKAKRSSQRDVQQVEKGWVKLSSKMETHNFHLRHKQEISSAAFQAKITPRHLIQKRKSTGTKSTTSVGFESTSMDAKRLNMTPEELVADSFKQFRVRLGMASEKWLQSRNLKTKSVVQEIIQSGVKNPAVELISLPDKSMSGNTVGVQGHVIFPANSQSHSPQLRSEELTAMYYEDERRKMVLSEQEIMRSMEQTRRLFSDSSPKDVSSESFHNPQSPYNMNRKAIGSTSIVSKEDLENIFRYLMDPQILTIAGRTSREFVFQLEEIDHANIQNNGLDLKSFIWTWRDPYLHDTADHGWVKLSDIAQVLPIVQDDLTLLLGIVDSNIALKNSMGRTQLLLRCDSPIDRDKLAYAFSSIIHFNSLG